MTRIVYQDAEEFADAMRGASGHLVRTGRPRSEWWIESRDFAGSSLQQLHTGGPFAFAGTGRTGTLTFNVPLTDTGVVRINGQLLDSNSLMVLPGDRHFVWTASDACRWGTLTLFSTPAAVACLVFADRALQGSVCQRIPNDLLANVRRLIEEALSIAGTSDTTAARRGAAQSEIITALTKALNEGRTAAPAKPMGRPPILRSTVIVCALRLMAAHAGAPLFIDDLCRATCVSERALRNIFNEYFGVGPMRLLKVRQLHEIRAALKRTDPQSNTVTRIATDFGVFDLSLLARNYKALFDELPSQTLSRPATESPEPARDGWLQCASRMFVDEDPGSV